MGRARGAFGSRATSRMAVHPHREHKTTRGGTNNTLNPLLLPPSNQNAPQEDFDAAAAEVVKYSIPNQTELLDVYALFKQATVGDVNEGA